jgi:hypothetical protein
MAVVVTYTQPATGTTPPTFAQMLGVNILSATVSFADADTTGVITHSWALAPAAQALIRPIITFFDVGRSTAAQFLTWTVPNGTTPANTVTFNKTGNAGSAGTFQVNLFLPHSMIE